MIILGINIKGLTVSQGDERQLRELISTPQGSIEVYEPTLDVLTTIIDLQRDNNLGMEDGTVSFSGVDVIKILFPLLTNIEFEDISDEELAQIIENPSVHLLIAQQVVAQIISEANKLYAERIKTELMNTESTMAQMELMNSIPSLIIEKAKKDGTVAKLLDKVDDARKGLEDAMKREEAELANEQ